MISAAPEERLDAPSGLPRSVGLSPQGRLALASAAGLTVALLAAGLWAHWPWLEAEHARLPPALAIGVWCADGTALVGFLALVVRHAVLGRPLTHPLLDARGSRRAVALGAVLAVGVDLASTIAISVEESAGEGRAAVAVGHIAGGRPTVNGEKAYLACRFQTPDGVWREGRLQVGLSDQPPAVQQAVRAGRFPIPVTVRYDPEWPQRCWLDGFDNQGDNRLHWMSVVFLLFQGFGVSVVLVLCFAPPHSAIRPVLIAVPLLAELVPFKLAAAAKFCEGEY